MTTICTHYTAIYTTRKFYQTLWSCISCTSDCCRAIQEKIASKAIDNVQQVSTSIHAISRERTSISRHENCVYADPFYRPLPKPTVSSVKTIYEELPCKTEALNINSLD